METRVWSVSPDFRNPWDVETSTWFAISGRKKSPMVVPSVETRCVALFPLFPAVWMETAMRVGEPPCDPCVAGFG